jgi:hypothetical protein
MANTKLTLSSDKDTIQLAKQIAAESNMSVSKLFKKLINEFDKKKMKAGSLAEKFNNKDAPEWMKELIIARKPTPNFDHKAEYHKHLEEKFGL